MTEVAGSKDISEIGVGAFGKLTNILAEREGNKYNAVGWSGTGAELKIQVNGGKLCPASAFAVLAEGIARYKRQTPEFREDTDSVRRLGSVLSEGSDIYGQASEIDQKTLKDQIRKFVLSHGGTFDENVDWQAFIKERADKLKQKADAIDAVNR